MAFFMLMLAFGLISVIQVSTASPISAGEEIDAAKMFSEDEIRRAKNAGITMEKLVESESYGPTFEDIMKMYPLIDSTSGLVNNITFDMQTKICKVMIPEEHETATNYTIAQESTLRNVLTMFLHLPERDHAFFVQKTVCSYISQPDVLEMDASAFGIPFISYLNVRFLKMKAKKSTSAELVDAAKATCCRYKNPEKTVFLSESAFSGLTDEDMNEFEENWSQFETENTLKAFENVCNFLHAKNLSEECNQ